MKFGQLILVNNGMFDGCKGWILDKRPAGYIFEHADREADEYLVRIFFNDDQYYDRWLYEGRLSELT